MLINSSILSNKHPFAKMIRWSLRALPSHLKVPILSGKLKGRKWIAGSGNHSHWLGTYEIEKQKLFAKTIKPGSVVYDIGGHVGFYTLLSSYLVGQGGQVYAFEPLPRNLEFIYMHLKLNQVRNVDVIPCAVSDSGKSENFLEGPNSYMGRLSPNGKLIVETVAIDDLCIEGRIQPPDYIKIDVEGAEFIVLKGAKAVLGKYRPLLFIATHGIDAHARCNALLESMGYTARVVGKNDQGRPDEILAKPHRK
jgi:FkbM family methyltransferase